MTSETAPRLRELSDREILQLMVNTLLHLEKRTKRIEEFLTMKFGKEFSDFSPGAPANEALRKTILEYHDDALALMESN